MISGKEKSSIVQNRTANGASELVNAVFGERGRHTRMIYTLTEVPLDSACLIVFWAEVE